MNLLFTLLQTSGMIGLSYTGYRSNNYVKKFINIPLIKPYKNMVGFKDSNIVNEDMFCKISGMLTGLLIGRILWPIAIPISLLAIERDYGSTIKKFFIDIQKSLR